MNNPSKILFLYTFDFPYGNIEPYLFNELPFLSKNFKKVVIIPIDEKQPNINLPENVEVASLRNIPVLPKNKLLLTNLFFVASLLLRELIICPSKFFFLSRIRFTLSEILYAFSLVEKIKLLCKKENLPVVHYSFWMNDFVLSLSILKQKANIKHYIFRVHGFDLYEERREQNYIPFRERNYKYSSGIFAVSKLGLNYIKQRYSYSERAYCSYLGTLDHGTNPYSDQIFTIVTCSGIIPLKRLDLLAKALMLIKFPVNWYHFGEGNEKDEKALKLITNTMPQIINVSYNGQVSQTRLFDFYKHTAVSVFINLSETEGLPVSIMEAISFGIPIIGTDVGGTSEIVTSHTGLLVEKRITEAELARIISNFKDSALNKKEYRIGVKEFWKENFSAQKNYSNFCEQLLSLN